MSSTAILHVYGVGLQMPSHYGPQLHLTHVWMCCQACKTITAYGTQLSHIVSLLKPAFWTHACREGQATYCTQLYEVPKF